ncbi:MAG: substrate-binding periplasmic protein [Bdellovibrionales bacterium]
MKVSQAVLVVLLAAITSFGVVKVTGSGAAVQKESAFDRVMRTQTLRCGYILSPPFLTLDLKTGKMSGLAYEYVEALGKELQLKIDWTEEATWGAFQEGLNTRRYDAMCTPMWEMGTRAKRGLFTESLYDSNLSLAARADDDRFENLASVNAPGVTIATVEGDLSRAVREQRFPLTKELVLPAGTDDGQYFLNIATKKADLGFFFEYRMKFYNKKAKVKLKLVGQDEPVQSYGTAMVVAHGEVDLKLLLDSALHTLLKSGEARRIINQYPGVSFPTMK